MNSRTAPYEINSDAYRYLFVLYYLLSYCSILRWIESRKNGIEFLTPAELRRPSDFVVESTSINAQGDESWL